MNLRQFFHNCGVRLISKQFLRLFHAILLGHYDSNHVRLKFHFIHSFRSRTCLQVYNPSLCTVASSNELISETFFFAFSLVYLRETCPLVLFFCITFAFMGRDVHLPGGSHSRTPAHLKSGFISSIFFFLINHFLHVF